MLIITPHLIRKIISMEKLSSSWGWIQFFHNSNFLLKALSLSLVTNTASCLLWSDRLSLFLCEKTSTKHPNGLKNHSLSVKSLSQAKMMLHEISGQFSSLLQPSYKYFSPETATGLCTLNTAEVLHVYFPLYYRLLKRGVLKGQDRIKLILFTALQRTFLSETGLKKKKKALWAHTGQKYNCLNSVVPTRLPTTVLNLLWGAAVLAALLVCRLCKCQWKNNHVLVLLWTQVSTLWLLWKDFGEPPGV